MRPILWIISKKNVGLYGIPEFLALLDLFLREHVPSAAWPQQAAPADAGARASRLTPAGLIPTKRAAVRSWVGHAPMAVAPLAAALWHPWLFAKSKNGGQNHH